jgi:hypothetical protein
MGVGRSRTLERLAVSDIRAHAFTKHGVLAHTAFVALILTKQYIAPLEWQPSRMQCHEAAFARNPIVGAADLHAAKAVFGRVNPQIRYRCGSVSPQVPPTKTEKQKTG